MLTGSVIFGLLTFAYGFVTNSYLALLLMLFMGSAYQIKRFDTRDNVSKQRRRKDIGENTCC
ncbi:hypothetical protein GT2_40_00180 [Parageobacillus thermoglucosidasius NBRC 107763]|nr:hypothetical protein GT2_40_00180 [Parageobacillus thermoglucosidasius NBRC 107763]